MLRGAGHRIGIEFNRFQQHAPRPIEQTHEVEEPSSLTFAIAVPSFNQGEFIGRCVDSILSQHHQLVTIAVQDAQSSDRTAEVLAAMSDPRLATRSEPDQGQADGINRAFAETSSDLMAFLNADDFYLPGTLGHVAQFFEKHPKVDVVYGDRVIVNTSDLQIGRYTMPSHRRAVTIWGDYIPQETMFWRRSAWDAVGSQLNPALQFALDWDLKLRFVKAGLRFAALPRPLAAFRVHAQQKTQTTWETIGRRESNQLLRRFHGRLPSVLERRLRCVPFMIAHLLARRRWQRLSHSEGSRHLP